MKLFELIENYNWDDVSETFYSIYPDQIKSSNGYIVAYNELQNTVAVPDTSVIVIEHFVSDDEDDVYEDVYSMEPGDNIHYGLDFLPWSEVLGMDLSPDIFEHYNDLMVISHMMFEITFYGYSSMKVKEESDKLQEIVDDVKNRIANDEFIENLSIDDLELL